MFRLALVSLSLNLAFHLVDWALPRALAVAFALALVDDFL